MNYYILGDTRTYNTNGPNGAILQLIFYVGLKLQTESISLALDLLYVLAHTRSLTAGSLFASPSPSLGFLWHSVPLDELAVCMKLIREPSIAATSDYSTVKQVVDLSHPLSISHLDPGLISTID